MLHTPLYPKFQGEGRRITFSSAPVYHRLIQACIFGGGAAALAGVGGLFTELGLPNGPEWWMWTGSMVCAAGMFAVVSLEFIAFDMREGIYRRRDGAGTFGTVRVGKLSDLDALVVSSHMSYAASHVSQTPVYIYRLTLHWKNGTDRPMILTEDHRRIARGNPVSSGAGPMLQLATRVSNALQVRVYDQSASPVN